MLSSRELAHDIDGRKKFGMRKNHESGTTISPIIYKV